jgi:hypothetical protein
MSQTVASQVGNATTGVADAGSELASAANAANGFCHLAAGL